MSTSQAPTGATPLSGLPGLIGLEFAEVGPSRVVSALAVRADHLVPGGDRVHAAAVVALADTSCGVGCEAALPPDAVGFTTIELKSNHLGTARIGQRLDCTATPVHLGRSTQVWDALVSVEGKTVAMFRCTQMVLRPR